MHKYGVGALVLAAALGLAGCPAGGRGGATPAQPPQTVTMRDFAFEPKELTVNRGKVSFTFKNSGPSEHNFTVTGIKGADSQTLKPGATQTRELTFDRAGTYDVVCTVPGHADAGMKGRLTVR